jgi:conjugative relaxase-like TrwC/TraI family protein
MSLHKLSAGGGVDYLLRHTCCGDVERAADTPLSAYYTASGYPPGRWLGAGLAGLNDGHGIGGLVDEQGMDRLFSLSLDPATAAALGKNWAVQKTTAQRVTDRIAALPAQSDAERAAAIASIEEQERGRRMPLAVSGFDLTFTVPKSVSVLWVLADPATQTRIANAHRAAVDHCLHLVEADALFTRIGAGGAAQVPVRGAVAAAFDHWDTRTGDPNLHTHLVLANKVQGLDGRWRSIDAKALYAAAVAVSEVYDCLIADAVTREVGTNWSLRDRGERRSAAFEIDGVDDVLLAEFSTRATQVQASLRDLLADFRATKGRDPGRPEMLRLRHLATRKSRPVKQLRPLPELLADWRRRAQALLPEQAGRLVARVLRADVQSVRFDDVGDEVLHCLAGSVVGAVMERRATWTRWNLIAEAARASKTLRLTSASDRVRLVERVAQLAIEQHCLQLTPPDLTPLVADFARADGASAFRRHRSEIFTSPTILDAEARLLAAAATTGGPRVDETVVARSVAEGGASVGVATDQRAALRAIATSGRVVDVLVGPAGSGKTRTLQAIRDAWENGYGPGMVVGLAPSATAANELAAALGIGCENTAKWVHETTGPAGRDRAAKLQQVLGIRATAVARRDAAAVARIDCAGADLVRAGAPYRLRANQLLILDEASLAGTLTLDQLTQQVQSAGAKLLVVGDHRQLASVDAGGAFGLLATQTNVVELTSLWRFHHAWEAEAGQQLRVGDEACLDTYAAHGRLHDGRAELMTAAAYTAWEAATAAGQTALLIAPDNATVAELNRQARDARVCDGLVERGGVRLHDDTTAGVGDTIVTRLNRRDLRTSSGAWVRNGDLWTITARRGDGALTVRRLGRGGDPRAARSVVRLPAEYVTVHVELGYATTAHRAQGMTVDASFAILRPGMSRELAYVALTRGRAENDAFIATDIPDLAYDGAPAPEQTGHQVMTQILATTSARTSATETLRGLQDGATSLARLAPIHETLVQAAQRARWTSLIAACGLGAEQTGRVLASQAFGPLVAALRRAEHDGHPTQRVLPALVVAAPLVVRSSETDEAAAPIRDVAGVLHHRVVSWHENATPSPGHRATPLIGGLIATAGTLGEQTPKDQCEAITELESLIAARVKTLTQQAISNPPGWLRQLGAPPADPGRRAIWTHAVAVIAAYRDRYNMPDRGHPLGAAEPSDPAQRRDRSVALAAARQARTAASAVRPAAAATAARSEHRTPSP